MDTINFEDRGFSSMVTPEDSLEEKGESLSRLVWKAIRKDKIAFAGLTIITFVALIAIFATYVAPYDPIAQRLADNLKGPSWSHPLGQDELGRDLLSRIIYGSRVSLEVGAGVVGFSLLIGLILGTISGYYGGKVE